MDITKNQTGPRWKTRDDFWSDASFVKYMKDNLHVGMRVRCTRDFKYRSLVDREWNDIIKQGDEGVVDNLKPEYGAPPVSVYWLLAGRHSRIDFDAVEIVKELDPMRLRAESVAAGPVVAMPNDADVVVPVRILKKRKDFWFDSSYIKYICENLTPGTKVTCRKEFRYRRMADMVWHVVKAGAMGEVVNVSFQHGRPPVYVYWENLERHEYVEFQVLEILQD